MSKYFCNLLLIVVSVFFLNSGVPENRSDLRLSALQFILKNKKKIQKPINDINLLTEFR